MIVDDFLLWTPEEGRVVEVGAEQRTVTLPPLPLPVHKNDIGEDKPSTNAIGKGLFDFLKEYPDCPYNKEYAELLKDAFPHYFGEIGVEVVLIDHRGGGPEDLRRKINYLKILSLVEPENADLLQHLGISSYEYALCLSELKSVRFHLLESIGFFQRSLNHFAENPTALNYMGQIEFIMGDYHSAARHWQGVIDKLEDGGVKEKISKKLTSIENGDIPAHPLVKDLEGIGAAIEFYEEGNIDEATRILDDLEKTTGIFQEFGSPEFYYLLAVCKKESGDRESALNALEKALEIDPEYAPALEEKALLT